MLLFIFKIFLYNPVKQPIAVIYKTLFKNITLYKLFSFLKELY